MGLEKILRYTSVGTLGSASAIFSVLSYRSFERGNNASLGTYTALTAISAVLAIVFQRYSSRKTSSEETGVFGISNEAFKELEKKNSNRYRAHG